MAGRVGLGPPVAGTEKPTIWQQILEHNKVQAKQGDGMRPDANVYFVGMRHGAKSTLLNRFLYPDKMDVPKPTEGLEYTYARKSVATNIERKDIAHIWEISGSQDLAVEVTKNENLFLGQRQVATSVVVICVDLSVPSEVPSTLLFWLEKIREKSQLSYDKLEKRGSKLPDQLKMRARKFFGAQHEDKESVLHSGISVVIAATKYDKFKDEDAELRKVMARFLRYVAHLNGAALIYTGGLKPGEELTAKDSSEFRGQINHFRTLLNHLVFVGPVPRQLKLPTLLDHMGPLCVPIGQDKFKDIGRPRVAEGGGEGLAEWKGIFEKLFPPKAKEEKVAWTMDTVQYAEPEVDAVRAQKDAEVASFKKQQQALRQQRANAKAMQQQAQRA
mmetsp:Transcript_17177/g.54938  ORF Transcript_17177/g.54938 Transcript_17177/m.54938 type:complete len:387 (-) Transcript_17177:65-1225(-)